MPHASVLLPRWAYQREESSRPLTGVELDERLISSTSDQRLNFSYNLSHQVCSWWYENLMTFLQLGFLGLQLNIRLSIWDILFSTKSLEEAIFLAHQFSDVIKKWIYLYLSVPQHIWFLSSSVASWWQDGCWSFRNYYDTPSTQTARN